MDLSILVQHLYYLGFTPWLAKDKWSNRTILLSYKNLMENPTQEWFDRPANMFQRTQSAGLGTSNDEP